jgi:phage terminase large subunit GpA-like protein
MIAAPGMYDWVHYAYQWLDIFKDGTTNKAKLKVFHNVVLGEAWQEATERIKQNQLAQNIREYPINTVPNSLSERDGNGRIYLLTCACDLNGTEDDGRLDYEIVAHSESGATYSVDQGSIGTFKRGKQSDEGRIKYTYRNNQPNNVWDEFFDIIDQDFQTDDGETMRILLTGIDTGYFTNYAYYFMDANPGITVGIKGKVSDKFQKVNADIVEFKVSTDRSNLYIIETDKIKDRLAEFINLPKKDPQVPGFMNFPQPEKGKYTTPGFFQQFEAEEKKIQENDYGEVIGWKWDKKNAHAQNHFFDTRVYNLVLRDIIAKEFCKSQKLKEWSWQMFCNIVKVKVFNNE